MHVLFCDLPTVYQVSRPPLELAELWEGRPRPLTVPHRHSASAVPDDLHRPEMHQSVDIIILLRLAVNQRIAPSQRFDTRAAPYPPSAFHSPPHLPVLTRAGQPGLMPRSPPSPSQRPTKLPKMSDSLDITDATTATVSSSSSSTTAPSPATHGGSPSTSASKDPAAAPSYRPDAKARRYDRQLRLWASAGQRSLENARVLLVGADAVGCQALKNLVLPGMSLTGSERGRKNVQFDHDGG